MAKSITTRITKDQSTVTQDQELHSDHHPSLFGKTLIWNLDKDNGVGKSPNELSKGLEMEAYAIAQKMNEGVIDNGMLQELPHGEQDKFIAAIEKYLDPKQELGMKYAKNGTHEFGNLIFYRKGNADPTASFSLEEKKLQDDVAKLQKKYEGTTPPQGQVLIGLVTGEDGKKRVLVDVHAESEKSTRCPRVNLKELMKEISALEDNHGVEVVVGGDMNAGKSALPTELGTLNSNLAYEHSEDNSAFLRDGSGISVDAVISTDKTTKLQSLPNMNVCDQAFIKKFDKDKKEKEEALDKQAALDQAAVISKLATNPVFSNVTATTGNFNVTYRDKESQPYMTKLTFRDANQARQFTNLIAVNDRKQLFQKEGEVYLTAQAFAKIMKADMSPPKISSPNHDKLPRPKLNELQNICKEKAQTASEKPISKTPYIEYRDTAIRQDTRGVVDYSMQLTFNTPEEARAFSDAMGYKNKTKLFQKDNTVYIAKDIEEDFIKKTCGKESTMNYKARLGTLVQGSEKTKQAVEEESLEQAHKV